MSSDGDKLGSKSLAWVIAAAAVAVVAA